MKPFLVFFILIGVVWGSASTHAAFGLEAEEIEGFPRGPVREAVRISIDGQGKELTRHTRSFDSAGNLTEAMYARDWMDIPGGWDAHAVCSSDAAGNITEVTFFHYGRLIGRNSFRYDQSNCVTTREISLRVDDVITNLFLYTNRGNLTDFIEYDSSNRLTYRIQQQWDEFGNPTEILRSDEDGAFQRTNLTYLPPHRLLEMINEYRDGALIHQLNEYDIQGNLVKTRIRSGGTETVYPFTNTYDDANRLREQISWSNLNTKKKSEQFAYYANGVLASYTITIYDQHGGINQRTFIRYNEKGNRIEEIDDWPNGTTSHTVLEYNEKDQVIRATYVSSDDFSTDQEFAYDSVGQMIEEICRELQGETASSTRILYTYDSYGNMTQKQRTRTTGEFVESSGVTWTYTYYSGMSREEWLNLSNEDR